MYNKAADVDVQNVLVDLVDVDGNSTDWGEVWAEARRLTLSDDEADFAIQILKLDLALDAAGGLV